LEKPSLFNQQIQEERKGVEP